MSTHLDNVRAKMAQHRAVIDRTVADFVARTRAQAARLPAPADEPVDRRQPSEDYDQVDSWMADSRDEATTGPPRSTPLDDALDRLDRGELSWGDVLSGRATDPSSAAVRTFLEDRLADVRRAREAGR